MNTDALSALLHHLGVAADHAADLPEPSVIGTEGEVASPTYVFWPVWAASNLEVRATLEALRIPAAANHSSVRTVPVWTLTIRLDPHHYVVQLRQSDLALVAVWDYARPACYLVYPWPLTNPDEGPRQLVCDPWHPDASPLGWHRTNDTFVYLDTQGNNVRAQLYSPDRQSGSEVLIRPQGTGPDHSTFAFPLDLSQEPTAYGEASVTQLFYHTNMMHDLLYGYGFDEPAGNFQTNNFGRGGLGNDALVAYAQNPDRFNNAYFNTPPDGEAPTMWMFLFNLTTPHRDDTLDRTVVVHEYTHGLTARLTGGPANTFCLLFGESAGLGEGWSDFVAAILQVRDVGNGTNSTGIPYPPIAIGAYVSGKPGGLRLHPFSTDRTVNPVTYSWLNRPEYFEIHAAGEVWASLLYEVFWNLVDRHGFDADWWNHGGHEKGSPSQGNVLALQLVVDGLKLQPCFPTFLTARDAIIHAEDLRTHGTNRCEVWRGFAKRGLGLAANYSQGMYTDDFTVPTGC
ncbi:hypothetical protein IWQ60_005086 [Tieghemiomyces parasiticus]|uniref:Extracellular metalloproteinase n=1 Tax=Tieghemiomyces parasiticus TaxID=78921 RepID=A0A9W8DYS0_9FUNG|nr:hypothetical protein IWQ60_005086 [Tieghemiomyces parasiticus]